MKSTVKDDARFNELLRLFRGKPCSALLEKMRAQERNGPGIKAYLRENAARDIDPDQLKAIVKFVGLLREKSRSVSQ
jgi:hypothetical protein